MINAEYVAAYRQGLRTYHAGDKLSDNPYPITSEYWGSFRAGYQDAFRASGQAAYLDCRRAA